MAPKGTANAGELCGQSTGTALLFGEAICTSADGAAANFLARPITFPSTLRIAETQSEEQDEKHKAAPFSQALFELSKGSAHSTERGRGTRWSPLWKFILYAVGFIDCLQMSRSITSLNIAVKKRDLKYVRGDKLVGHKALGRKKGSDASFACLFTLLRRPSS